MIKQLIERHYQAQVRRGTINHKTKTKDFIEKSHEENMEMLFELPQFLNNDDNNFIQETIDSIMPKIHMLKHLGYDFEKELEKNTIYQENRED